MSRGGCSAAARTEPLRTSAHRLSETSVARKAAARRLPTQGRVFGGRAPGITRERSGFWWQQLAHRCASVYRVVMCIAYLCTVLCVPVSVCVSVSVPAQGTLPGGRAPGITRERSGFLWQQLDHRCASVYRVVMCIIFVCSAVCLCVCVRVCVSMSVPAKGTLLGGRAPGITRERMWPILFAPVLDTWLTFASQTHAAPHMQSRAAL